MPQLSAVVSIPYLASDFPVGSRLNGSARLRVTWRDLLLAAITVGKASLDVLQFGRYSIAEVLHRVACFEAYFDIKGSRLVHSPAHATLDPTEKALVSYYLGMVSAKIYADKVLGIPWMMHISRYESKWSVRYGSNPAWPDLFGCNASGDWIVAEAKGRSRVTTQLISKMQAQKSAVASINGFAPAHRIGVASRFSAKRLDLRVVDPPARQGAQEVSIDPALWLIDYYRPLVDLIDSSGDRREAGAVVGLLPGTNLELSIPSPIADLVRESNDRGAKRRSGPAPRRSGTEQHSAGRLRLADQAGDPDLRSVVERLTAATVERREMSSGRVTDDGLTLDRRG